MDLKVKTRIAGRMKTDIPLEGAATGIFLEAESSGAASGGIFSTHSNAGPKTETIVMARGWLNAHGALRLLDRLVMANPTISILKSRRDVKVLRAIRVRLRR